ncbi:MAG TPA: hypothetical protein VIG48_01240 [Jatrophihabitans sp.]
MTTYWTRYRGVPLAVRAVVVAAGLALLVLPGALHPVPFLITLAGLAAAVAWPRTVGVTVLSAGFVIAWLAAGGWAHSLPVARTVPAAAALYVAHVSSALAAAAPLGARVERPALLRWLRGCLWPVLGAALVVAVDLALPRRTGAAALEVAGLAGVLLLGAAAVWAVRRRVAG